MEPEQLEQIRIALLRYLDATAASNPGRGVSGEVLRHHLLAEGQNVLPKRVESELVYLESKGYVARAKKTLSPENILWLITAEGRDQYALLTR